MGWSLRTLLGLLLFFTGFTALGYSALTHFDRGAWRARGTAMGVFASQFIGVFIGGLAGGFINHYGSVGVWRALVLIVWWAAIVMVSPDS